MIARLIAIFILINSAAYLKAEAAGLPQDLQKGWLLVLEGQPVEISLDLPHNWTEDERMTNINQATYVRIIDDPALLHQPLTIKVNGRSSFSTIPYELLLNGQVVYKYGNLDKPDNLRKLIIPPGYITIPAQETAFRLDIRIARNEASLWPGLHLVELGFAKIEKQREHYREILAAGMMGALVLIAFYHFMQWWLNRSDISHFLFVCFAFTSFIFTGLHLSPLLFKLFPIDCHTFWLLQSFAWFGTLFIFDFFTYAQYRDSFPRKKVIATALVTSIAWLGLFYTLFTMLFVQVYSWFYLSHLAVFAYRLPKDSKKNRIYSLICIALIIGAFFDLLTGIGIVDLTAVTPYCFLLMVCLESYLLSYLNKTTQLRLIEETFARKKIEDALVAIESIREKLDDTARLGKQLMVSSRYLPAETLGGDWLSFSVFEEDQQGILMIGDVTGHGMSSGLMAVSIGASIHGTLQTLKRNSGDLSLEEKIDSFLSSINSLVCEISPKLNKGITLLAIGLDFRSGNCLIRNHGHTFPYLLRQDNSEVIIEQGGLLGFEQNPEVKLVEVQLEPGDKIFVYTDGLLENGDENGKILSNRALRKALRAIYSDRQSLETFEHYRYAVGKKSNDGADDLAYMLVEWLGHQQPKLASGQ